MWFPFPFQDPGSENVDPELQTTDETRPNKRHHDDITSPPDVEDIVGGSGGHQNKRLAGASPRSSQPPTVTKHTLTNSTSSSSSSWLGARQRSSWREVLGPAPSMGNTRVCMGIIITIMTLSCFKKVFKWSFSKLMGLNLWEILGKGRFSQNEFYPLRSHKIHVLTYVLICRRSLRCGLPTTSRSGSGRRQREMKESNRWVVWEVGVVERRVTTPTLAEGEVYDHTTLLDSFSSRIEHLSNYHGRFYRWITI